MKEHSSRVDHSGAITEMSSEDEEIPRQPKRTQSGPQKRTTESASRSPIRSISLDPDNLMQFDDDEESEILVEVSRPAAKKVGGKNISPKRRGSGRSQRTAGSRGAKKDTSNHKPGKKSSARSSSPRPDSFVSDIESGSGRSGKRTAVPSRRSNDDAFDDEEVTPQSTQVLSLGHNRPSVSTGAIKPLSTRASAAKPLSIRPSSVRGGRTSAISTDIRPHSSRGRPRPASIRAGSRPSSSHHKRAGERSSHDKNGELVPYYPGNDGSEGSEESFHDGGELIEFRGNDNNDVDYDADKLRPPPKIKLQREDSETGEFPQDVWWQKCLRHFRILSPHPNEEKIKREVRLLIWSTLVLDVLVAVVSIATFGGTVTQCCDRAVMASIPGIDWNLFMNVISYIYLIGIFLEIHPVVREGPIPWNLLNPVFGFLISFAVFVDDSKGEAITIWIMEMGSVILEIVTYRRLRILHARKHERLDKLDDEVAVAKGRGYKKTALLRERRETRIVVATSRKKLQYHFVGVTVNSVLTLVTLLMIIFVARGGGLCLVGGEGLDIFSGDQRSRCFKCAGNDICEECTESGDIDQCYYPYF